MTYNHYYQLNVLTGDITKIDISVGLEAPAFLDMLSILNAEPRTYGVVYFYTMNKGLK